MGSRGGARGAGLPALFDWWPAYFLVCVLALLAVLITGRTIVEILRPFGHVLVVASVAAVLTFALSPLISRLERFMPRRAAAVVVFFGTLLTIVGVVGLIVWQLVVMNSLSGPPPCDRRRRLRASVRRAGRELR